LTMALVDFSIVIPAAFRADPAADNNNKEQI
jgi:hypothetical protein